MAQLKEEYEGEKNAHYAMLTTSSIKTGVGKCYDMGMYGCM